MRRAWVLVFGVAMSLVPSATAASGATLVHMPAQSHERSLARGTSSSTNWSGYAAYNSTFSDVRASWTQPSVNCSTKGARYAAFWVGLDGYTSNSVEQIGTDSDCASRYHPVYYAWYEMYPAGSVTLSSTYAVQPGDNMSADVAVSGTTFTLTLTNATRGWTYTTAQTSTVAQDSSAEWVAEAPSSCFITCSVLPLANFGTMNFTAAATTGNGVTASISGFTNDKIVMVTNGGTTKALPSALSADGSAFSDTWYHS